MSERKEFVLKFGPSPKAGTQDQEGWVDTTPDGRSVLSWLATWARDGDVAFEKALATLVSTYDLEPALARSVLMRLCGRNLVPGQMDATVEKRSDAWLVRCFGEEGWSPFVSPRAASVYYAAVMAAAKGDQSRNLDEIPREAIAAAEAAMEAVAQEVVA